MEYQQVATSRFSHAKAPSWECWDEHFSSPLYTCERNAQMLDFEEYDVRSHGVCGTVLKYGVKAAKYSAVYETTREQ